jgi:P-type Cu+ transporter
MSIMVGVGRAATDGVLFKDARALETLRDADLLVVDKTGTLTEGRPQLTDIEAIEGADPQELLQVAASVEAASEHPVARAIVEGAEQREIELLEASDFQSTTGQGVVAQIRNQVVLVGNSQLLSDRHVPQSDPLNKSARVLRQQGKTVVFVATEGRLLGLLAIADPIKANTAEAVQALHRAGIEVLMMTGDHEATARYVAGQLDIDKFEAGVSPERKHDRIQELRNAGRIVAMAGDGINDAPALAAADVGIAMGTGADVAIESADVTLIKGDLRGIVRAVRLSHAVMRNIRQNLFFAFAYNALGIPIAAGVLVPLLGLAWLLNPMIAAAAMSLSSVSVIGNALRLRRVAVG